MLDDPIQVLLIEDDPSYGKFMEKRLKRSESPPFELERADRLSTGLDRLGRGGIDVLLLDLGLPDSSGADTFEQGV